MSVKPLFLVTFCLYVSCVFYYDLTEKEIDYGNI